MSVESNSGQHNRRIDDFGTARVSGALSGLCAAWFDAGRQMFFGSARTFLESGEELVERSCGQFSDRRSDNRGAREPRS